MVEKHRDNHRRGSKIEREIIEKLDEILHKLKDIQRKEVKTMKQIDDLKANVAALIADVAAEGTVVASAVAAINGLTGQMSILSQQLADAIAANDPVAIQEAADAIAVQNQLVIDQTAQLAAAIPTNTEPAPVPE